MDHLGDDARLPDSGGAGHRDQARAGQVRGHRGDLLGTADEAGRRLGHGGRGQRRLVAERVEVDLDRLPGRVDAELLGQQGAAGLVGADGARPVARGVQRRDQRPVRPLVEGSGGHPLLGGRHRLRTVARDDGGLDGELAGAAYECVDPLAVHLEPLTLVVGQDVRAAPVAQGREQVARRPRTAGPDQLLGPVEEVGRLGHVDGHVGRKPVPARHGRHHRLVVQADGPQHRAQPADHAAQRHRPGRRRPAVPDELRQPGT